MALINPLMMSTSGADIALPLTFRWGVEAATGGTSSFPVDLLKRLGATRFTFTRLTGTSTVRCIALAINPSTGTVTTRNLFTVANGVNNIDFSVLTDDETYIGFRATGTNVSLGATITFT